MKLRQKVYLPSSIITRLGFLESVFPNGAASRFMSELAREPSSHSYIHRGFVNRSFGHRQNEEGRVGMNGSMKVIGSFYRSEGFNRLKHLVKF